LFCLRSVLCLLILFVFVLCIASIVACVSELSIVGSSFAFLYRVCKLEQSLQTDDGDNDRGHIVTQVQNVCGCIKTERVHRLPYIDVGVLS
jgi:hypothetical protein